MPSKKIERTCEQCIHEYACQAWNIGSIHNMNATNCSNYETAKDSNAYFLGVRSVEAKTAVYDIDQVVNQMKNMSYERYGNDGMGGEHVVNLDDAIEIVKGCGVNV